MSSRPCVIIVDRWTESRQLLRTLLERSGAIAIEASSAVRAVELTRRLRPDAVVYDSENGDDPSDRGELAATVSRIAAPVVVVGTVKHNASPLPTDRFISKPYHYAPLLRRIEECIDRRR